MASQIRALVARTAGRSQLLLQSAWILTALAGIAQANSYCSSTSSGVPEIDAGSAASGLALLAGGVLLLKEKFFPKTPQQRND